MAFNHLAFVVHIFRFLPKSLFSALSSMKFSRNSRKFEVMFQKVVCLCSLPNFCYFSGKYYISKDLLPCFFILTFYHLLSVPRPDSLFTAQHEVARSVQQLCRGDEYRNVKIQLFLAGLSRRGPELVSEGARGGR